MIISEDMAIRLLIIFDMFFAVIIGKIVYDFLFKKIEPVGVPSVFFVITSLPEKGNAVMNMVYILCGSSATIFIGMLIFVLVSENMILFYGICILTFLSIIYLMIFISTMKKYEQKAVKRLKYMFEKNNDNLRGKANGN